MQIQVQQTGVLGSRPQPDLGIPLYALALFPQAGAFFACGAKGSEHTMVQRPDFIALSADTSSEDECDDGYEPGGARFEDDPFRASRRRRYFSGILDARARARALAQRKAARTESRTTPAKKREDVKDEPMPVPVPNIVYEYEPGFETPEARLEHLRREVEAWCGGRAYLNMENLKPESQDFVDGRLTATYLYTLGQCVQAEANAAKRRAKRHRKKYYALVREGKIAVDFVTFEEYEELSFEEKYALEEEILTGAIENTDVHVKKEEELLDVQTNAKARVNTNTKASANENISGGIEKGVDNDIGPVPVQVPMNENVHVKQEDVMEWSGTTVRK